MLALLLAFALPAAATPAAQASADDQAVLIERLRSQERELNDVIARLDEFAGQLRALRPEYTIADDFQELRRRRSLIVDEAQRLRRTTFQPLRNRYSATASLLFARASMRATRDLASGARGQAAAGSALALQARENRDQFDRTASRLRRVFNDDSAHFSRMEREWRRRRRLGHYLWAGAAFAVVAVGWIFLLSRRRRRGSAQEPPPSA